MQPNRTYLLFGYVDIKTSEYSNSIISCGFRVKDSVSQSLYSKKGAITTRTVSDQGGGVEAINLFSVYDSPIDVYLITYNYIENNKAYIARGSIISIMIWKMYKIIFLMNPLSNIQI